MLKLSKKTDYAIILLTHLGEANAPVSAQKVAEHYQLPYPMVQIYLNCWSLPV